MPAVALVWTFTVAEHALRTFRGRFSSEWTEVSQSNLFQIQFSHLPEQCAKPLLVE